jgi:hypothetical protein
MASLRRKPNSRFWIACFTLPNGHRSQRNTKETVRKRAQRLADTFEEATCKRMSARQAQRIISDIYRTATGHSLPSCTVQSYFESWRDGKLPETSHATGIFYAAKLRRFLRWLGERANQEITAIAPPDILDFRRQESGRVASALRHTATSFTKNAGISPAIVQDIIGHESAAISANYTHIDDEAKRRALSSTPSLAQLLTR